MNEQKFKSEMTAIKQAMQLASNTNNTALDRELRAYQQLIRRCHHGKNYEGSVYRQNDGFNLTTARSMQAIFVERLQQYGIGNVTVEQIWRDE